MKRKIYKIVLLVIICSPITYAQGWEVIGEMPYPVAGGAAVVYDSKIFVLGGYSDFTQDPVDLIQVFDPITREWELLDNMNEARYGLSAGIINDKIYYFGGIQDSSEYISSLESYLAFSDEGVSISLEHNSFNRSFATSVVHDNSLYIFGGEPYFEADSLELPYLSIFDLGSFSLAQEYDTLFSSKELAHHQMSVKVKDQIYIFGGVSNSIENRIYLFDLETKKFTRSSIDMILPRASGAAVYLEDRSRIYLIGGLDEVNPALSDVEVFNLESETSSINEFGSLNVARSELMAAVMDNVIYVMGGKDEFGNVVSTIEIYPGSVTSTENYNYAINYELFQNYPNPFNPETTISFNLPEQSEVSLVIYNSMGEQIKKIIDGTVEAGSNSVKWDGKNSSGYKVPSGVYLYKLSTSNNFTTKKMTLLK